MAAMGGMEYTNYSFISSNIPFFSFHHHQDNITRHHHIYLPKMHANTSITYTLPTLSFQLSNGSYLLHIREKRILSFTRPRGHGEHDRWMVTYWGS
jgi:hypothetical protein